MAREVEAAKALRAEVATGGHVVLIDPDVILPSPVTDRLSRSGDLDAGFEELKASISSGGQTVPVLLRTKRRFTPPETRGFPVVRATRQPYA